MVLKDKEARRAYHREYVRRRLREDPEFKVKYYERVNRNDARYRKESLQLIADFRSNGCALCDENEPCCMSAHHVEPGGKDFAIGDGLSRGISPKRIATELRKCVCVCENCHRKIHAGLISSPVLSL